jgi:hypothetical protein
MLAPAADLYAGFPESEFVNLFRSPGIDSQSGGPDGNPIFDVRGPPGYIGWRNQFLESTPGLLERLQIRAQPSIVEFLVYE